MKKIVFKIKGRDWIIQTATPSQIILVPIPGISSWRHKHKLSSAAAAVALGISTSVLGKYQYGELSLPVEIAYKMNRYTLSKAGEKADTQKRKK